MYSSIILILTVAIFTLSSFSTKSSESISKEVNLGPGCAELAWDATTKWCKKRGGCSEYLEWAFTDIAYDTCSEELGDY